MSGDSIKTTQLYLKGKNIWWIRLFIGLNIAVFLSIATKQQLTTDLINHFWQRFSAKDGLLALCFPLVTLVLNGVLGDLGKARLVFWRWSNPLPGCRAFSDIMITDPRINAARLRIILNHIPSEPKEQNATWYRLYKAHANKQSVTEAHRAYLLTRDMAALAAVFVVSFSLGMLIVGPVGWKLGAIYAGALLIQYVLVATSARNYGNRFVANVLTEESHA
jgi:hypothetical protein